MKNQPILQTALLLLPITILGACSEQPAREPPDMAPLVSEVVQCSECFPFESLPPHLQPVAAQLLLDALDSEALYSVLAELKPMSSGWASREFAAQGSEPQEIADLRTIAAAMHCGSLLSADVQVFAATYDGMKYADGILFRRDRFAATVDSQAALFQPMGVTPDDAPIDVVDAVDADTTSNRFRAYGHLFGYPAHAVEFFAMAEETEEAGGGFVERDFIHIPTFVADEGRFTYAVPKGHQRNAADQALAERAAAVLTAYRYARDGHVTSEPMTVLALVRDVFKTNDGRCSPSEAEAYVQLHGVLACAGPGDHCSTNAVCCSDECHGDHCH